MSRGKFIPGGGGKKDKEATGRQEPLRASNAEARATANLAGSAKRVAPKGPAGGRFGRQVTKEKRPVLLISSVGFLALLLLYMWVFKVLPAQREKEEANRQLIAAQEEKRKQAELIAQREKELLAIQNNAKKSGLVQVNVVPEGAKVTIGDEPAQPAPAKFDKLPMGKMTLTVEMEAFETYRTDVTLTNESMTIPVTLVPKPGTVKLDCAIKGVTYFLSGPNGFEKQGTVPATIESVPVGSYTVIFEHRDWQLPKENFEVESLKTATPPIVFPYGTIQFTIDPPTAIVREGTKIVGQGTSPLTISELRSGEKTYSFDADGYRLQRVKVNVEDGKAVAVNVALKPAKFLKTSFGMPMVEVPGIGFVGKYEVTQEQYAAVMGGAKPSFFKGANLPVEQVSWTQAMEFCERATALERAKGGFPSGYAFTLPTDAQWEVICGDADPEMSILSWGKPYDTTQEVGSKNSAPNSLGLFDTLGNVQEWTRDAFDPALPNQRYLRGGSFLNSRKNFAGKQTKTPSGVGYVEKYSGFRVILAPER